MVAASDRGAHTRFAWDGRGRLVGLARQLAKPGTPDPSLSTRYAPWWFRNATDYDEANRVVAQSTGADVAELMVKTVQKGGVHFVYESEIYPSYSARGLLMSTGSSYGKLISGLSLTAQPIGGTAVLGRIRHYLSICAWPLVSANRGLYTPRPELNRQHCNSLLKISFLVMTHLITPQA
jgi:hypothetical protein